jgi:hypothetical protein
VLRLALAWCALAALARPAPAATAVGPEEWALVEIQLNSGKLDLHEVIVPDESRPADRYILDRSYAADRLSFRTCHEIGATVEYDVVVRYTLTPPPMVIRPGSSFTVTLTGEVTGKPRPDRVGEGNASLQCAYLDFTPDTYEGLEFVAGAPGRLTYECRLSEDIPSYLKRLPFVWRAHNLGSTPAVWFIYQRGGTPMDSSPEDFGLALEPPLAAFLEPAVVGVTAGGPLQTASLYVVGGRVKESAPVAVEIGPVEATGANPPSAGVTVLRGAESSLLEGDVRAIVLQVSAESRTPTGMMKVPITVRQDGGGTERVTLWVAVTRPPDPYLSGEPPAPAVVVAPNPPALAKVGFAELKLGDIKGDEFGAVGLQLTASKGRLQVLPTQLPAMVMPAGQAQVLTVSGDRVTEFALEFSPPVTSFTITLPGLRGGASFPTYSITAFNPAGLGFDVVGQEHWIPSVPDPVRITLGKGLMSRAVIFVDNRFGNTAWATYNCLPIAGIELQR